MNPIILLVEGDPSDEELTVRALEKCAVPHQIVVARDGAEALDYIFATGAHAGRAAAIDLRVVLLELTLPHASGAEVLRRLRADERTRALPVVVLTASQKEEDVVEGYRLGANGYVRKSVDLTGAVATIGAFWLSFSRLVPAGRRR